MTEKMANLIQNNSQLIEQQTQISNQTQSTMLQQNLNIKQNDDMNRHPKTIRIIKDQSGFGFNVN